MTQHSLQPLTILNVAYPLALVGPDAVGGAEQVLTSLDIALVRAGHKSIVIAPKGSITAGLLYPLPEWDGPLTEAVRQKAHAAVRETIREVLRHHRVDVIHLHGIDFYEYLPDAGTPVLATLHLPPSWYLPEIFRISRSATYLNCVSAAQHRACPASPILLPEIPNGVEVLSANSRRGNFAMALGRICPEKGFHLALQAAAQADIPFVVAGQVFGYEAHEHYFAREIAPRWDHKRRFLGPIGRKRKVRLLSAARCLLAPSLAPETSSLVAMEALACGAPVIAFPSGALPEIVEHGKTGFLVNSVAEMAEAIHAAVALDPSTCREAGRTRFSLDRMVQNYFAVYEQLAEVGKRAENKMHKTELLTVQEITTTRSLHAMQSEWRELWHTCPSATPFQSPAWLIPWWENFGRPQNASLITLVLHKEQKLIGLAPLFIQRQPDETRTVLLLGTGNSDYLDILLAPDFAQSGVAAILDYLASQAHRWDVCDFQNLQAGSLLCSADIDCANLQTQDICPVLTLPSAKEALSARVPSQILANFRYYRRRAEKLGRLQLERATPENLNSFLETFIELHQARWLARGGAGVLADVAIQQFHREAGPELLGEGLLRLYLLRLGGRPLAALYALAARQRFYYYLSGFDPEFSALSPGTLVIGHVIEQAIEEGFLEFDFLRGRESYKYHWGAQERPIFRLQIRSNGGSGRPQEPHGAGSLPLAVP